MTYAQAETHMSESQMTEQRTVWLVRAGTGGRWADAFLRAGVVAVDFRPVGPLTDLDTPGVASRVAADRPDFNPRHPSSATTQLQRFALAIREGELVASPSRKGQVLIGEVVGGYEWRDDPPVPGYHHLRQVRWLGATSRDSVGDDAGLRWLGTIRPLRAAPNRLRDCVCPVEAAPSEEHRAFGVRRRSSPRPTPAPLRRPRGTRGRLLVLSRKGWDSDWGGGPSPILPDGRMVSMPIPEPDKEASLTYADCWVDERHTYLDLLRAIRRTEVRVPTGSTYEMRPASNCGAHLDPDLREDTRPRPDRWRPLFGQTGGAQAHLENQGVGPGDLFLFFGLYRHYQRRSDGFLEPVGRPLHILWGWMEVGECRRLSDGLPWHWAIDHPHVRDESSGRYAPNNTVYAAADRNTWADDVAAGGLFERFDPGFVLTAEGGTVSRWRLPASFHPDRTASPLSYHTDPRRWTTDGDSVLLATVGRGQEFVVEATDDIEQWVACLLAGR